MVRAVFDNLAADEPRDGFTVGIVDDVTHLSLPLGEPFPVEPPDRVRAVFYGLGSDGTVSAPTRTRSRSSASRPTSRSRATSSTTRRRPAR